MPDMMKPRTLREVGEGARRRHAEATLRRLGWNVAAAARELGIDRVHLTRLCREWGLKRPPKAGEGEGEGAAERA